MSHLQILKNCNQLFLKLNLNQMSNHSLLGPEFEKPIKEVILETKKKKKKKSYFGGRIENKILFTLKGFVHQISSRIDVSHKFNSFFYPTKCINNTIF
jgi:hypothetical protein